MTGLTIKAYEFSSTVQYIFQLLEYVVSTSSCTCNSKLNAFQLNRKRCC